MSTSTEPQPPPAAHLANEGNDNIQPAMGTETPDSALDEAEKNPKEAFKPGARFYIAFGSLMLLSLMAALDGTTISVSLPIMTQKLKGTAIEAFWAGTSFLLTGAVIQPLVASLSHIFGRRPMLFLCIAFFLAGALIAALCNNFTVLIVGRVIQGIGGGGLLAMIEILITDLVPLRYRGDWMGLLSAMWSLGSVTGPIIGGAFTDDVTWRWIFWLNLPFIGISVPIVWFFLKMNFQESDLLAKLRRVDWVGMILFVASTTSMLVPITWGGVMYAWDSWHTLVPLLVGLGGLVAFLLWEIYFAKERMIRGSIFKETTAKIAYFTTAIHGLILWCILYYLPLYYQAVQGYSAIISGVALFPGTFTVAPMAAVTGILITKTGHYRWFIIVGWIVGVVGCGLLCLLGVNTSIPQWIFITLPFGVGLGVLFPAMTFAVQASSTEEDMAFAVAMFAFFRTLGQSIGVAVGGVIFQNTMKKKLLAHSAFASNAAQYAKDATGLVQIIHHMQNGPEKLALRHAFADSVRTIWYFLIALTAVCMVLSWWIKSFDLNRALGTQQGFQHRPASPSAAAKDEEKQQQQQEQKPEEAQKL